MRDNDGNQKIRIGKAEVDGAGEVGANMPSPQSPDVDKPEKGRASKA